jgi:hypothetical protein
LRTSRPTGATKPGWKTISSKKLGSATTWRVNHEFSRDVLQTKDSYAHQKNASVPISDHFVAGAVSPAPSSSAAS